MKEEKMKIGEALAEKKKLQVRLAKCNDLLKKSYYYKGTPDFDYGKLMGVCERLKDKKDGTGNFAYVYLKSAVTGLIKYHEDRIEELIKRICVFDDIDLKYDTGVKVEFVMLTKQIEIEYENVIAIEHWLEDAI